MPQAALGSGQPRPISRLGGSGHTGLVFDAGKPADYFARSKVAVGKARDDWKALMDYLKM